MKRKKRSQGMTEKLVVPTVPAGVVNQNDLYNDAYNDLPDLRWGNLEFHDRMLWATEEVPHEVSNWYAVRNSSPDTSALGPTMTHVVLPNGEYDDIDVRNWLQNTDLLVVQLKRKAGVSNPVVIPYPGYTARNPPSGVNPVGPKLPKQPWAGRTLYADMAPASYQVGQEFTDTNADRYTKVSYIKSVQAPWGGVGVQSTAWEQSWDSGLPKED